MKKVIMKDIAEKANVSLATVSYILNNVEGQSISVETKCKVLQIAKELNYIPNLNARTLASKKSGLIGIMVVKDFSIDIPWSASVYIKLINKIENKLNKIGYHILLTNVDILIPELDIILQRQLDGAIIIDVSEDIFYKISHQFYSPILLVDSFFKDDLFTKIVLDYEKAINKAKNLLENKQSFLIADKFNNKGVMDKLIISSGLDEDNILFVSSEEEIAEFIKKHQNSKGIIINEFLSLVVAKYTDPSNLAVICTSSCPEILPTKTKKITFNDSMADIVVKLITAYIKGNYSNELNKYCVIEID
jgi:transcriptional regulator with XRE-family HTH domain